jgi:Ca2+-binding RTX toxin-like protein
VDNNAQIYLNSPANNLVSATNQIGAVTGGTASNFQDPPESFGTTANFVTGTNILYFRVSNFGGPTGLDYQASMAYCQAVVDLHVDRTCAEGIPTIVGTPGPDTLIGTTGPDFITGLVGNDRIDGLGGDDIICGDEGNDFLRGDAGNDRMFGGAGDDGMWGDAGDDNLNSVDNVLNNDQLDGGAGTADTCTSDPDPESNCEL